ncbi:MAG TPA: Ig-like domain-containing protein [Gemmatimonadaceae bacterium]|nr:Ig-like domain-containing protein [Gemmatimonadaceae bacterium]
MSAAPSRTTKLGARGRIGALVAACALAIAGACSDSSTAPKPGGGGELTITLSPSETQLDVGSTTTLTATVTDANGATVHPSVIVWSSEDTALADVSSSGVVRAKQPGEVHIAASASGHSGIAKVVIVPTAVATVTVSPATARLVVGASANLTAAALDAAGQTLAGRDVAWTTSDASIASVDADGRVTAIAPGAAIITATSGGRSGSSAVTVVLVPVGSIAITPSSAAIVVGQTAQLTDVVKDASGGVLVDRFVTWSSSNDAVATVSSSGLVVARTVGSASITASVEGKSATASVTVSPVPVSSVTISPTPVLVTVGEQLTVSVIITDANGTVIRDRPVTFSSDAPSIATVSSTGVVRGVAPGTTTIRAESEGKTGTATVTVSPVPAASVTVTPSSASLIVGTTTTLTATVKDASGNTLADRPVTWTTSNAGVATVSANGVVTAVAPGTAIVTATREGKSDQATITVSPVPVARVDVTPSTATVVVGQTVQLTATPRDASGNALGGRTVTWTTSDPLVALVSSAGLVTGLNAGSVTITATVDGKQATAIVTVQPVPVGSVTVTPTSAALAVGGTATFEATVKDPSGNTLTDRTVTWSSSDVNVATVSSSGVVTAVGPGTATITASTGGKSGQATVTVSQPTVASVDVAPEAATLTTGQTQQLVATPRDASGNALTGRAVVWTTSNAGVATVSGAGLVTAVAPGTATITATVDGVAGTSIITVQSVVVAVASVTLTPTSATLKKTQKATFTASCLDAGGNVLTGRAITFTTSDPKIAKINSFTATTVTIQGMQKGKATVTATCESKSAASSVTVTD